MTGEDAAFMTIEAVSTALFLKGFSHEFSSWINPL